MDRTARREQGVNCRREAACQVMSVVDQGGLGRVHPDVWLGIVEDQLVSMSFLLDTRRGAVLDSWCRLGVGALGHV